MRRAPCSRHHRRRHVVARAREWPGPSAGLASGARRDFVPPEHRAGHRRRLVVPPREYLWRSHRPHTNFDRIAREGARFTHAFAAAPSCSPSRAALLTGQAPHRLEEGGNLWGSLPKAQAVYPDLVEQLGYSVGFTGKGWGPGRFEAGGRQRNPAGPQFKSFDDFLKQRPAGAPFCFWFGSTDPHRPYEPNTGAQRADAAGSLARSSVPPRHGGGAP